MKLILRFILCLCISISSVFAAVPVLPAFRTDIEVIAYPSTSPEAVAGDKQIVQAIKQMQNAGFSDRVNNLFLAYKNKDIAWNTAQTLLKKIQNGQINSKNISTYISSQSKNEITPLIDKIRGYKDLVDLSAKPKGVFPDRMLIKQKFNQDQITIKVISFIYPHAEDNGLHKTPASYLSLVLSAEPPYKKWLLSKMYITPIK